MRILIEKIELDGTRIVFFDEVYLLMWWCVTFCWVRLCWYLIISEGSLRDSIFEIILVRITRD